MLKTKYLLPLILILFLTFTLTGNCDWLEGWDYRIELAIGDYAGDIGGSVTWFPVDVFLTATQAEEVFVELTTDAEYKKMQFTQSDGTSLLYGHMKLFDVSEELGIFTVSATGWTVNANTSVFVYYDKDHADNDTYIGATNTAACENVYNNEFASVYPMDDGADTSSIYDATSNNYDGSKLDANDPVETAGKIGQAQDFDGTEDWIDIGDETAYSHNTLTFEAWVKIDDSATNQTILGKSGESWLSFDFADLAPFADANKFCYAVYDGSWAAVNSTTTPTVDGSTWYYVVGVHDGNNIAIYVNGALEDGFDAQGAPNDTASVLGIGGQPAAYYLDGIIDEPRISATNRSAAWIKGTYNSGLDALFTYGSEETEAVVTNVMFMFSNF